MLYFSCRFKPSFSSAAGGNFPSLSAATHWLFPFNPYVQNHPSQNQQHQLQFSHNNHSQQPSLPSFNMNNNQLSFSSFNTNNN